jgi:hypothetical protein
MRGRFQFALSSQVQSKSNHHQTIHLLLEGQTLVRLLCRIYIWTKSTGQKDLTEINFGVCATTPPLLKRDRKVKYQIILT